MAFKSKARTVGEMLSDRDREIRSPIYRMKLALRDEPDYKYSDETSSDGNRGGSEGEVRETVTRVVYEHSNISEKQGRELLALRGEVEYLKGKLEEKRLGDYEPF